MSEKNNAGLVDWAHKALDAKWRYWYGVVGRKCTMSLYNGKRNQYPAHYPPKRQDRYAKYMQDIAEGRTCCDCVNLIKAYAWDDGGTQRYATNGCPDTNANGMFERAKEKGAMATMPEIPGLAVRFDGHVGVYVGDGWVIEARGFDYGVVRTKLTSRPWTHWYKLHWLAYVGPDVPAVPRVLGERTLKLGSTGEDVRQLQGHLIELGHDLGKYGADGEYGPATVRAVKAMQTAAALLIDGLYGPASHAALMAMLGDLQADAGQEGEAPGSGASGSKLVVTGGTVNVRAGPGTQYDILTVVRKDVRLDKAEAEGWAPIIVGGAVGWISKKYVREVS